MSCYESTPLHFAATEMAVNELVSTGALVNARNCSGNTPLHSAVIMERNLSVIKSLISAGAKVNAAELGSQFTALHYANSEEIVKELLSHGADVNFLSCQGGTPLHFAIRANKDISVIKALLSGGADPNATTIANELIRYNSYVETPLLSAVYSNAKPDVVKLLLSAGSKITGLAVLHKCSCPEIARLLISYGADVNEKSDIQDTPLHVILRYASSTDDVLDLVRLLLKSGANLNAKNSLDIQPTDYVGMDNTNLELITELIKYGMKILYDVYLHALDDTSKVTDRYMKMLILTHHDSYKDIIIYDRQWCLETTLECSCIKWLKFIKNCDREVVLLKKFVICGNISLFSLVTSKPVQPLHFCKEILTYKILATFPIYHDMIEEALKQSAERASLRDKFIELQLSSKRKLSDDLVVLNLDCMNSIADYLWSHEMFIFITAMSCNARNKKLK